MANQAEQLQANHDEELATLVAEMPAQSQASESTVVHTRVFEDGSALVVSSHAGGPVEYEVREASPAELGALQEWGASSVATTVGEEPAE